MRTKAHIYECDRPDCSSRETSRATLTQCRVGLSIKNKVISDAPEGWASHEVDGFRIDLCPDCKGGISVEDVSEIVDSRISEG